MITAQLRTLVILSELVEVRTHARLVALPILVHLHNSHVQQIMVISSPLSDFLALWSSHCQVKNLPHGADSADPYYQILLFSVARGRGEGFVRLEPRSNQRTAAPRRRLRLWTSR